MSSFDPVVAGIAVLVVAVLADLWGALRWNRAYFAYGIPIFMRRIPRPAGMGDVPMEKLEAAGRPAAGAPLLFRQLAPDLIGFREQAFAGGGLRYKSIMHGVIRYDATEGVLRVVGLVKSSLIVLLLLLTVAFRRGPYEVPLMALGVFALIYFIQAVRFNRVANVICKAP